MNNIDEKIKNMEEWNKERKRIKPFIDIAVGYHNKARLEVRKKDHEKAGHFFKEAIKSYKDAFSLKPKYYFEELLERIDDIIGEYVKNTFTLKVLEDKLRNETEIREFVNFIDNLKHEERKYLNTYDIAQAYLLIGDFYYERKDRNKALEFYNRIIDIHCDRPFINRDSYFNIGNILFEQARFKEALVSFVSTLSFDRENRRAVVRLEACLEKLGIQEHREKFLAVTPNEAKKLIMEVL